jgi:hypothetical protein
MKFSKSIICCLVFTTLSCLVEAQGPGATPTSVHDFVQQFYAWYVPKALGKRNEPAWDLVLKDKGAWFDPELSRALKEDSDAQAKVKDDIVGLDFDPFLNSQDPCKRYELGKISPKGTGYWVEVFGICSGKANAMPDVICEVEQRNGQWQFVNFYYPNAMKEYPNGANLLAMLKLLREERRKSAP